MIDFQQLRTDLGAETSGGGTHGAYQDVVIDGKVALRGHRNLPERFALFDIQSADLCGARLLDLGCNLGGILGHYGHDSDYGLGLDSNPMFIRWARALYGGRGRLEFWTTDINALEARELLGAMEFRTFDIVFLLSAWDYLDHPHLIQLLHQVTHPGTVFYFEGHKEDPPMTVTDSIQKYKRIVRDDIGLRDLHFLGCVDGGQRPVFRGVV